jgi:transcriptional regulator with XRE-family HTH domain
MSEREREIRIDSEEAWRELGERLREAREYVGLSQEAVATTLGIPRPSVSGMETGKRKVSTIELQELARLYKRPYSYFLGEEDEEWQQAEESARALFRTAKGLSDRDREQVMRFAEFLRNAGQARPVGVDEE